MVGLDEDYRYVFYRLGAYLSRTFYRFCLCIQCPPFLLCIRLPEQGWGGKKQIVKVLKTLFVPYLIVCTSYLFLNAGFLYPTGDLTIMNIVRSAVYMLLGYQSVSHGIGAVAMWFVYTLMLIKLLYAVVNNIKIHGLVAILALVGAYYLRDCHASWAVQNVLVSLPFFYLGLVCRKHWGTKVNEMSIRIQNVKGENMQFKIGMVALCLALLAILVVLSAYNGFVQLYNGGFGENIFVFLLNAIIGILLMFIMSSRLSAYRPLWLHTISTGSILILAYQYIPIKAYGGIFIQPVLKAYKNNNILTFIAAILIMVAFVPLIRWAQKHVPILMGGRK